MPRIVTLTPHPALDLAADTDKVEPGRKLRCSAPRTDPGGGGVNVARAAHRLGAEVLAVFPAGGVFGEKLAALVEAEGVPALRVPIAGETRLAFVARERETGAEFRFNLPAPPLAADEAEALIAALARETGAGDIVVGSGSLTPGAPDDFWGRAARVARKAGARMILDTTDGEAAALAEGLYLLRKNRREADALAGRELGWPDEAAAFAQAFCADHGPERLVITHGAEGALMAGTAQVVRTGGIRVQAVSAVGAGDSFVAAMAAALLRGLPEVEALRHGMAGASATLLTPGTALFDPAEVARLLAEN